MARSSLITNFHCTDCGGLLSLSYKPREGVKMEYDHSLVTGAAKVEQGFWIEPCRKCVGDARKPLALLREALLAVEGN